MILLYIWGLPVGVGIDQLPLAMTNLPTCWNIDGHGLPLLDGLVTSLAGIPQASQKPERVRVLRYTCMDGHGHACAVLYECRHVPAQHQDQKGGSYAGTGFTLYVLCTQD